MVAEATETFGFERGEGEVDFDGEGVEEGAEPELCGVLALSFGGVRRRREVVGSRGGKGGGGDYDKKGGERREEQPYRHPKTRFKRRPNARRVPKLKPRLHGHHAIHHNLSPRPPHTTRIPARKLQRTLRLTPIRILAHQKRQLGTGNDGKIPTHPRHRQNRNRHHNPCTHNGTQPKHGPQHPRAMLIQLVPPHIIPRHADPDLRQNHQDDDDTLAVDAAAKGPRHDHQRADVADTDERPDGVAVQFVETETGFGGA